MAPATASATATAPKTTYGKGGRGLAVACQNSEAKLFAKAGSKVGWYYHWNNPAVPELDAAGYAYVPMLWGNQPDKVANFQDAIKALKAKGKVEYVLAFNEPDLPGQALMSVADAVTAWKKYIQPLCDEGTKCGAPAIAAKSDWLEQFFTECVGCTIDFVPMHAYHPPNLEEFKNRVQGFIDQFKKHGPIWVTEYGVVQSANPTEAQVLDFQKSATEWLASNSNVDRYAWFGVSKPEETDSYVSPFGSMITSAGALSKAGEYWLNG
ncbi:hypothetical protein CAUPRSCDRAFT_9027 [Caulochytrium protostelioides]|nr:hypothetical protein CAUPRSCDRAFT_9027 [Caulochytrium protostelioides]